MHLKIIALLIGLALFRGGSGSEEITLESVPPVVIKTVPEAGAAAVDPSLREIRVSFSKTMMDQSWSWVTISPESYPKTTGKPQFDDAKRTCVLPVKLQPGKTYAIWLNHEKFHNFHDANGQPAIPYLLVFKTRGAPE